VSMLLEPWTTSTSVSTCGWCCKLVTRFNGHQERRAAFAISGCSYAMMQLT
jgi:hypothetical protein